MSPAHIWCIHMRPASLYGTLWCVFVCASVRFKQVLDQCSCCCNVHVLLALDELYAMVICMSVPITLTKGDCFVKYQPFVSPILMFFLHLMSGLFCIPTLFKIYRMHVWIISSPTLPVPVDFEFMKLFPFFTQTPEIHAVQNG